MVSEALRKTVTRAAVVSTPSVGGPLSRKFAGELGLESLWLGAFQKACSYNGIKMSMLDRAIAQEEQEFLAARNGPQS